MRVACWDLDEKAAVQVVCELEELGGTGLPIKVIIIAVNGNSHNCFNNQMSSLNPHDNNCAYTGGCVRQGSSKEGSPHNANPNGGG